MNNGKALAFVLAFISIATLLSLWSLYFSRVSWAIAIISLAASFFAIRKYEIKLPQISMPAALLCILIAALSAYPYVLIHPFVDASADPAAHISSLAIGDKMPQTYEPFSKLGYRYQIGFPVFAKMLIDLLPAIPSNAIVWGLGALFALLSATLVYCITKHLWGEKAGIVSLALFIGSKIVFQNMYWGQYTFMMASVFFLATFLAVENRSALAYIFFPSLVAAHPGVAFYAGIFFVLRGVIFSEFRATAILFLSGLLALPAIIVSYLPYISNFGAEAAHPLTVQSLAQSIAVFPPWIGLLVFATGIFSFGGIVLSKKIGKMELLLFSSFIISALLAVLLSATGRALGGRVIELSMFCALFISAGVIARMAESRPKFFGHAVASIALVSLILFFSSSELTHLREGSKITPGETAFAYGFKKFDPEMKTALFLLEDGGKVAEIAEKIPYDAASQWYVSYDLRIAGNDPYYPQLLARHELAQRAVAGNCPACISQILPEVDYVVARKNYPLEGLNLGKAFEYGDFAVFSKKQA